MDAQCVRHYSRQFTCIQRFYMFRDVRSWVVNASGMTLADLHAPITVKVQINYLYHSALPITRSTFHTLYAGVILYIAHHPCMY